MVVEKGKEMIRGKSIYLHCKDGQRAVLEQKSRNLGANPVGSIDQADVVYVVGETTSREDLKLYQSLGKQIIFVNEDLINQELVEKLLSGRIRVKDADRER